MSELEIWNELGNIYYNAEAYDEAIHAYHKAIELDHGCGQSFSNLASIYIHKEYYAEAILMYQKGIELMDNAMDKAILWNRLGDAYLRVDDYDDAMAAYQTAAEFDPKNDSLKNDLAKVKLGSPHSPSTGNPASLKTAAETGPIQAPPPSAEPPVTESTCLESQESPASGSAPEETEIAATAAEISVIPSNLAVPESACLESQETLVSRPVPEETEIKTPPEAQSSLSGQASPESACLETQETLATGMAPQETEIETKTATETTIETTPEAVPQTPSILSDPAVAESVCVQPEEILAEETRAGEPGLVENKMESASVLETSSSLADTPVTEPVSLQPEENLAEAAPVEKMLMSEPRLAESDMETETVLKVASILSDPPVADPACLQPEKNHAEETLASEPGWVKSEMEMEAETVPQTPSNRPDPADRTDPETACWIFKTNEPADLVDADKNSSTIKPPLILGSRLLIEAPGEEAASTAIGQAEGLSDMEKKDATDAPDQLNAGIVDSANPADIENPEPLDRAGKKNPLIEPRMGEPINSRAHALLKLGLLHWRRGDNEGSLQFLKTALNLAAVFSDNQFEALCFNAIARVETDLGKAEEAIRAYENAASLDPEHIFPWSDLGYLYSKGDRYEEALAAFKKAIGHNPKDPISWNGLGDVYHKLGRNEEAISAYQLGNVLDRPARNESAITLVQKDSDTDGEDPRILEEMGKINYINGAYDDAINAYSNAIELLEVATDKARLWKRLGDAYQRLNENDNATAAYRKAAELGPENAALQDNAARIATPPVSLDPKSCPETSKPIVEIDQEDSQSFESGHSGPVSAEPEEAGATESDPSTGSGSVEAAWAVPEVLPAHSGTARDPEPEAPYWVFEPSSPVRDVHQPKAQFTSAAEPLGNTKPSPAFVLPKFTSQALLDKPLLTDTYADTAVMVVEQTPEKEETAKMDYTQPFIPQAVQDRSFSEVEVIESSLPEPVNLDTPAPASANPIDRIANQIGTNIHTLEKDIAAYQKVTEINPLNDRAWDALGNMYEATGLHNEAINAYEKAISLASQREVYHYHLGLAHAAQKRYDKAIRALQKVVALNPDYMLAHCALAGYYRRIGKEAEAKEHIAIARPYIESENDYNQACFESICGNTERALAFLRNALDKKQIQVELVRGDPDLDFIRNDPRFEELIIRSRNIRQ